MATEKFTKSERLIVAQQEVAESHALIAKARKLLQQADRLVLPQAGDSMTVRSDDPTRAAFRARAKEFIEFTRGIS